MTFMMGFWIVLIGGCLHRRASRTAPPTKASDMRASDHRACSRLPLMMVLMMRGATATATAHGHGDGETATARTAAELRRERDELERLIRGARPKRPGPRPHWPSVMGAVPVARRQLSRNRRSSP
jgi:hypothetical protein